VSPSPDRVVIRPVEVPLRQRLAVIRLRELEAYYEARHNAVRYTGVQVPAPCAVQEFVQAWRQLRRLCSKQAAGWLDRRI
jgi:hypothetical protein